MPGTFAAAEAGLITPAVSRRSQSGRRKWPSIKIEAIRKHSIIGFGQFGTEFKEARFLYSIKCCQETETILCFLSSVIYLRRWDK